MGCLSNGAGLAMATIDRLRSLGVRPANFCDVGKEASVKEVVQGLRLARNNSVETVLINVFCSVTSCEEVARGIVEACQTLNLDVPLVVRLEGTGREQGHEVLAAMQRADLHDSGAEPESSSRPPRGHSHQPPKAHRPTFRRTGSAPHRPWARIRDPVDRANSDSATVSVRPRPGCAEKCSCSAGADPLRLAR